LLNKVTRKIDTWHKQIGKETFENDADFVENENSPSKFDTSSEEEVYTENNTGCSTQEETMNFKKFKNARIR
jgi:hypothetical protein